MATNPVELTTAFTRLTRRISGSFSPATWHSSSTMARRWCCLPAMSSSRTELGTVGASLGTCRPPWLLSSSEPAAVRFRPAREVAIAMTREDPCGYRVEAARAKEYAAPARRHHRQRTCGGAGIGVQRVEAFPVPAQARDGSHQS